LLKNDFEPHIFAMDTRIEEVKNWLLSQGAIYASMSGSGSAVFGLSDHEIKNTPPIDEVFVHSERINL
jgi:4-diphosphocytidyl-2-C-methyl-D-erythritol kinase